MPIDSFCEFANAQAVTSSAISDVYDTGYETMALKHLGGGKLFLVVLARNTATDVGSDATLAVSLESSSTADLATAPTVHFNTGPMAFAAYKDAGTVLACVGLPPGLSKRFLGVRFTVANGPLTSGNFSAFLTPDPSAWVAYANGAIV